MATGGAELAAQAVSQLMGVPISYTVVTTFDGLPAMVDELGGVTVNVPDADVRLVHRGPTSTPAPRRWTASWRCASPAAATSSAATSADAEPGAPDAVRARPDAARPARRRPTTVKYLGILARHTTLDGMSTPDLYRLARVALAIDPAAVQTCWCRRAAHRSAARRT